MQRLKKEKSLNMNVLGSTKEYMNDSHNPMNIISSSDPEFQIYLEEQWKEYKTKKKNGKKGSC